MAERQTGLADFTRQARTPAAPAPAPARRKRGQGPTVGITLRLTRSQWERLSQVALAEGDSLQGLALQGLALLLREKGLGEL